MSPQEGSLSAPDRKPIDWQNPEFYAEDALYKELERVYDLCHGCRRCISLCDAFPTLFDLVDESETLEVDGVAKEDYFKVVDHCYLCDLCFMTKCPYVPPHEWDIDFPHLMLRAKAVKHKQGSASKVGKILSATDTVGKLATIPVINQLVNFTTDNNLTRKVLDKTFQIHPKAFVPKYQKLKKPRIKPRESKNKLAVFTTCYGSYNSPQIVEDLIKILEHNAVQVEVIEDSKCCAMPKMEQGDLDAVAKAKEHNIPLFHEYIKRGFYISAPVPSCVLMYRKEVPLIFPQDKNVLEVAASFVDPFEYLDKLNQAGELNTDFKNPLGTIVYQQACHQRVQNFGAKTKQILAMVPDTEIHLVERCSGHDGTYGLRSATFDNAVKIARPVTRKLKQVTHDFHTSDCVIAGHHLANITNSPDKLLHPFSLLCKAYGI